MGNPVKEILDFLGGRVSKLFFEHFQRPLWEGYQNHLSNPVDALALFLKGYAFERRGRDPNYALLASDVVAELRALEQPRLWQEYSFRLQRLGKKPNVYNDPLYHTNSNCKCVICVFGETNIVRFTQKNLEAGNIRTIHGKLDLVRGVGPKIASLFLRDLAVYFGMTDMLKTNTYRYLLQPVDVWVKRTTLILAGDQNMKPKEIAQWLVENASEPERTNQGIWYFCSQILRTESELEKALRSAQKVRDICEAYVSAIEKAVSVWRRNDHH